MLGVQVDLGRLPVLAIGGHQQVPDLVVVHLKHLDSEVHGAAFVLQLCPLLKKIMEQPQQQPLLGHWLDLPHDGGGLPRASLPVAEEACVVALDDVLDHSPGHQVVALLLVHVVRTGLVCAVHRVVEGKVPGLAADDLPNNGDDIVANGEALLLALLVRHKRAQTDTNTDGLFAAHWQNESRSSFGRHAGLASSQLGSAGLHHPPWAPGGW
mmetsp:Transcript_120763/g.352715  ORF Transcript_120763/g.352715 Transcript_120763/m.352715 type:complete len:211 (-) Transcript_120763:69-701(-)